MYSENKKGEQRNLQKENNNMKIAQAIYTVNRHAKTAPKPQHLYQIKKIAIDKLLSEKKAKKIGLHYSDRPKYSNQYSTLLIQVHNYYFHIPPSKEDFKQLKHLGRLDQNFRNQRVRMSLSKAKHIIYNYINWQPKPKQRFKKKRRTSSYFTPSSLGKWPSHRN